MRKSFVFLVRVEAGNAEQAKKVLQSFLLADVPHDFDFVWTLDSDFRPWLESEGQ